MVLGAGPLAAQDNPFAFTGGAVKSAYIVYDVTSKDKQGPGSSYEVAVAPDRWIMKMKSPFELGGKKDTIRAVSVTTKDSQYTYNAMGAQGGDAHVGPTLRPHLAREYAALDAGGRARFRENVKLMTKTTDFVSPDETDAFITLTGEKTGSETVAGHRCDVYRRANVTACVLPQAPMVMLRWTDTKDGVTLVARKVTLNGPVPATAAVLPKGVTWKKKGFDDAEFILGIWAFKKQTDPAVVPGKTLTQFAVSYLASPAATAELREMSGGAESGEADSVPDDEAGEDQSGS
jgi:hypothetical protein